MMRLACLCLLLFSFTLEAKLRRGVTDVRRRAPRETRNTVRINDTELNDGLLGNSKISFKAGPDFQRYDLENLSQEKNSFYSLEGVNFQIDYDFWINEMFVLKHNTAFSRYQLRRYDGVPLSNEEKRQYSYAYGGEFILGNFYVGYQMAKERRTWMYERSVNLVEERRIKTNAHRISVGYRLYIYKPIAMDFFYKYSFLKNRADTPVGDLKGKETAFGFKVFLNQEEETQYGVEVNEIITNISWGTGTLRNKTFQILPYISF